MVLGEILVVQRNSFLIKQNIDRKIKNAKKEQGNTEIQQLLFVVNSN